MFKCKKNNYLVLVLAIAAALLTMGVSTAKAATNPIAPTPTTPLSVSALASQPTLGTTLITDGSGDYGTSTVTLDRADTTATMTASGYLCGDVAYNGIVKWYMAITGWVAWTYDVHFGAYVCNDMVRAVTHLRDTVDSIMATWSWCGTVSNYWGPALPYTSVHSYTEGCFTLFDKIAVTELPWVRMTIGGNGGLWARSVGVN